MKSIWTTKNPNKKHKKLSSSQKNSAKEKAKSAGRPYPNLVDNMNAAKTKNEEIDSTILQKDASVDERENIKRRLTIVKQIAKNINTSLKALKTKPSSSKESK